MVDVREEDGTAVIFVSGDLDMTSANQARAAIDAALGRQPGSVILDASGLKYIDSSGIALLALMARKAQEVQVRNPTLIVRRLLELTGLTGVLQISDENQS